MSRLAQLMETFEDTDYVYHYRSAKSSHACVACGMQAGAFIYECAELEFEVSGLCQQCQDEYFGNNESRKL